MKLSDLFEKLSSKRVSIDSLDSSDEHVLFFNDLKQVYKHEPDRWLDNAFDLKAAQILLDPDKIDVKHVSDEKKLKTVLEKIRKYDLFAVWQLESKLCYVTANMERLGVRVDLKKMSEMRSKISEQLSQVEIQIFDLVGERLNLNSPRQVEQLLFYELKLPSSGIRRTKTGYSTDADTLAYLSQFHPVPDLLLKHRALSKLLSGFINPLLAQTSSSGLIYPTIRQIGSATGRIIYEKPNLQNLPIKDDLGRAIRDCIVPEPGCVFVRADYSQIELRVLAHLSEDPYLIDAFMSGKDIHAETARAIFNLPAEAQVDPKQRAVGKTVNFSILYGMSHWGLAKSLSIAPEVAKGVLDSFFSKLSQVDNYFKRVKQESDTTGYLKSLLGRIRWINRIRGVERERLIKNTPIQASASDIIKSAMVDITKELIRENIKQCQIRLQVHDELVLSTTSSDAEHVSKIVRERMEKTVRLKVPLRVETKIGSSWGEVS